MNEEDSKDVSDWSLHTWQLPLSDALHLTSAYNLGQMQYVNATER